MRLKMMEFVGGFFILFCCAVSLQAQLTVTTSETGSYGDVDYELWNQNDQGTATMTINEDGTFSCEWSGIENVLFRTGEKLGSNQTYQEMGGIDVEFGADYNPDGNSYLCIYGWTEDPLVEYYIVESWGSWRPPGEGQQGSITVDGASYDLFVTERVNKPSIQGTATFDQYWSVRTSKRTSGTIPVSEHFEAWENNGLNMGVMYEVALTVEGYQSNGSANVHTYSINIGGGSTDTSSDTSSSDTGDVDYGVRSATSTIEAEEFNSTTGSDLEVVDNGSGGEAIGYINSGDAVTYNDIDFGDGVASVSVTVASEQSTDIEIRLGSENGTLLGTVSDVSTGGWDTYQEKTASIGDVTGQQDIVLVFSESANLDSFVFSESTGVNNGFINNRDLNNKGFSVNTGKGILNISYPSGSDINKSEISLVDSRGKSINISNISRGNSFLEIPTSHISQGVYILSIGDRLVSPVIVK